MNHDIKNILLDLDEIGCYETPSNFDYRELKSQVTELKKSLDTEFDLTFIIDDQVQDASFFCDIQIPKELVMKMQSGLGYSIRVSNFGRLSTINFEEMYSPQTNSRFKKVLENNGFRNISFGDLDREYDGEFEKFKEILGGTRPNWFHRYFDYL